MIAAELIDRAKHAGLELIDRGEKLRVRGPEPLPPDLLDALRESKGDILEHLRQSDPLPPIGDPRRVPLEVIDAVWAAGGWLVITGSRVRAVPRVDAASTLCLTPDLFARVEHYQAELVRALKPRNSTLDPKRAGKRQLVRAGTVQGQWGCK